MKKIAICAFFSVTGFFAHAAGDAFVTCGNAPVGVYQNGELPILHVSYSSNYAADVGKPGMFWLGVQTSNGDGGAFLSEGGWANPHGVMLPYQAAYPGGLPASIRLSINFPGAEKTTANYVGYAVGAGHGILNSVDQTFLAEHRAAISNTQNARDTGLDEIKAAVADRNSMRSGENSMHVMHVLAQKNMVDNKKYYPFFVVPFIDCEIPTPEGKK